MQTTVDEQQRLDHHILVRECAAGNPAYRESFVREFDRLLGATALTVRNARRALNVDVTELKQHVYLHLFDDDCRRLRAWRGDAKLSTYLVQVSRNLCVDYMRKQSRIASAEDSYDDCEPAAPTAISDANETESESKERLASLETAMDTLNPKQKLIVKLRLKGKSLREIAEILNLPSGTVFVENSRAIARLSKVMTARNDK